MAGIYTIGTKRGYELANGLQPGQSVQATDGSIWTKNQDGTLSVFHQGKNMVGQITYSPQNQVPTMQQQMAAMGGGTGYQSPYAERLEQVLQGIEGSKWEGWDKNEDPSYQAYRKEYLREADRSMEDTLGAYAQNTGGIAGSAAITAASQAADYYKAKLSDKIPELYDSAYSRYLADLGRQQDLAGLLMNADSQAQNRYYANIEYAMNKWNQMGYADQEVARILGVTAGTPTSDQSYSNWATAFEEQKFAYNQEQDALTAARRGSSGGGGGGGRGDDTDELIDNEEGGTLEDARAYATQLIAVNGRGRGTEEFVKNALKRKGYSDAVISDVLEQLGLKNTNSAVNTESQNKTDRTADPHRAAKAVAYARQMISQRRDTTFVIEELRRRGFTDDEIDAALIEIGI